jgi:hypothetical protein
VFFDAFIGLNGFASDFALEENMRFSERGVDTELDVLLATGGDATTSNS